jgi:hypothetical protein
MAKQLAGEHWKDIQFDFEFTNDFILQISNYGRVRSFNKISNGNILNGSLVNGYRIIRLKLYRPRDEKKEAKFRFLQNQVTKLNRKIKKMKEEKETKKSILETEKLLESLKKNLSQKFATDLKERTIHHHALIHRLVADYFLKAPVKGQTIVGHLDYNKINNRANNLKWMTPEENYKHQQNSPFVIKEKQERKTRPKQASRATKLTVTKVMLLKKLLNKGMTLKKLSKQFKISDMQVHRIKTGENWGEIEAAK